MVCIDKRTIVRYYSVELFADNCPHYTGREVLVGVIVESDVIIVTRSAQQVNFIEIEVKGVE